MAVTPTPTAPIPPVAAAPATTPAPAPAPVAAAPVTDFTARLNDLTATAAGKTLDTAATKANATAPYEQQLNSINTQLATAQANAIAHQESAARAGETLGYASREQQAIARTDSIEVLKLQALQAGAQGNIALAEKHAQAAIDTKYGQVEQDIQTAKTNLYDHYDTFNAAEKKRADATLLRLDANDALVKQHKADETLIYNTANIAFANGADAATVQKMYDAPTPQAAALVGAKFMQDPKAKYDLEAARLGNILTKANTAKVQRETSLLGQPSPTEQKAAADALKEAKASIPVMQDKIDLVDALSKSPGLASRVGTSFLTRTPTGSGFLGNVGKIVAGVVKAPLTLGLGTFGDVSAAASGAGQNFAGGVHKLVGGLTLDNLIAAKARGATFGALSEGELNILASSATALNDWEIKDAQGHGTGVWNIDEASFNKELKTIQDLTRRAIQQSTGKVFSPEEQAVFNSLDQQPVISAASYY